MGRKIIYLNDVCEEYIILAQSRDEGEEELEGRTDDELWELAREEKAAYLDNVVSNLNIDTEGSIVLTGKLRRWDGTYSVAKDLGVTNLGESVLKAMACFDGDDTFEVYVENDRMYLSQLAHDNPVNPSVMEFRVLNKGVCFDDIEVSEIEDNSSSPASEVGRVFGWEAA